MPSTRNLSKLKSTRKIKDLRVEHEKGALFEDNRNDAEGVSRDRGTREQFRVFAKRYVNVELRSSVVAERKYASWDFAV